MYIGSATVFSKTEIGTRGEYTVVSLFPEYVGVLEADAHVKIHTH
jgi:hypothetical protein